MKILRFKELNEGMFGDMEKSIFNVGKITKDVKVELELQHTIHSIEHQRKHDSENDHISNADIKSVVDEATQEIINCLIEDKINIGDSILITRKSDNLNVVGAISLKNKYMDVLVFTVNIVMRTEKFDNKLNSYKIVLK